MSLKTIWLRSMRIRARSEDQDDCVRTEVLTQHRRLFPWKAYYTFRARFPLSSKENIIEFPLLKQIPNFISIIINVFDGTRSTKYLYHIGST